MSKATSSAKKVYHSEEESAKATVFALAKATGGYNSLTRSMGHLVLVQVRVLGDRVELLAVGESEVPAHYPDGVVRLKPREKWLWRYREG